MDDYGVSQPTQIKYGEVFNTHFPYYLSIGMTEEQYWDGDNLLPRVFRKAEELRRDRQNSYLWLQEKAINTDTIMVHVRNIREKIEIDPKKPKYLKVVWGVGYKLEKQS